ncbi:hypothetical protein Neosp_003431 [[Neocosmospora] mangrovei]
MATMWVQQQLNLNMIGVGSSGQVYEVDDDTVVKAGRIYQPPDGDASRLDMWYYASESIFHFELIENERNIFRLEIAHSELRLENVLFDTHGEAIICDFSASAMFGQPNPAAPSSGCPVPINGLSKSLSAATDRFAFASLMFQLETGAKPALSITNDGTLLLPQFISEHADIGRVIKKSWLGTFTSTLEMLRSVESLNEPREFPIPQHTTPRSDLRELVAQWREERITKHGL